MTQPLGGEPPAPATGSAAAQAEEHLLATYRYLRLGIVVAVLVLAVSLAEEIVVTDCIKGSISAYWYSPVRSVLVGVLMAIGLCLIAIRGRGAPEEIALNLAGMLAPIVALVPTVPGKTSSCEGAVATTPDVTVADGEKLPEWVIRTIHNNVFAYLIVSAAVLVALIVWWWFAGRGATSPTARTAKWFIWSILGYAVLIGVGIVLFATFEGFKTTSHWFSAIAMFVAFFVVVSINWRRSRSDPPFGRTYLGVGIGMIVAAVVLGGYKLLDDVLEVDGWPSWDEEIFWLEVAEIMLFAAFWGVQTWQWWNEEPEPAPVPAA